MTGSKVNNTYKDAIVAAKAAAVGPADGIAQALDGARGKLQAQCWLSSTADTFGTELEGHRTALGRVKTRALDEFDDAISAQPDEVDEDDWRVHWARMARMRY